MDKLGDLLRNSSRKDVIVYIVGKPQTGKNSLKKILEILLQLCQRVIASALPSSLSPSVSIVIGHPPSQSQSSEAKGILICLYDVTEPNSFNDIVKECKTPSTTPIRSSVTNTVLVGNKIDMEYWRKVTVITGAKEAKALFFQFCEISAHTGMHIDYLVDLILQQMYSGLLDQSKILYVLQSIDQDIQSQELDRLQDSIQNLGLLGSGICDELKEQSSMLENLDSSVSLSQKKKSKTQKSVATGRGSSPPPPPPLPSLSIQKEAGDKEKKSSPQPLSSFGARLPPSPSVPAPLPPSASRESSSPPTSSTWAVPSPAPSSSKLRKSSIQTADLMSVESEAISPLVLDSLSNFEPSAAPQMSASQMSASQIRSGVDRAEPHIVPAKKKQMEEDIQFEMEKDISRYDVDDEETEEEAVEEFSQLDRIQRDLEDAKGIMQNNIETVLERGEKLEALSIEAGELQLQSATFQRKSQTLKKKMDSSLMLCYVLLCCPCLVASNLWNKIKSISMKSALFDNVLADTENAFQTLAKLLVFLQDWTYSTFHPVLYTLLGGFFNALSNVLSFIIVFISTVVLILPSFFTLLIVRTSTIEKESKAFGVRQEVIRHEKKEQSAVRWIRIILRSLPMSFYILALPYLLVFHIFGKQPSNKESITLCLVGYLCGVIVLQILGSVRAYYSWKSRDVVTPQAPPMYYEEEIPSTNTKTIKSLLFSCCSGSDKNDQTLISRQSNTLVKKKTTPPLPPNTFSFQNPMNLIELFSLTLEFFQMASFSLQTNPYENSDASPTSAPTPSPSGYVESWEDSVPDFWGKKLFQILYIHFPVESELQLIIMWGTIALVALLLVIFSLQFLIELQTYGVLMKDIDQKDQARDSFFYSFTGSIVYGHGKPRNISSKMRFVVSILSDALFLIVSIQLLQIISCDYDDDSSPTLRSDPNIHCWEGEHAILATIALTCYAFYVPLSIMITPMLLEAPPQETTNGKTVVDPGVSYLKLYLMTINVVKSVMLLVGVLGPQIIFTAVISSTIASFLLGGITYLWFQWNNNRLDKQFQAAAAKQSAYSSQLHPCNIAFINYWKAASYTASVLSALIVLVAYRLNSDLFPLSTLTFTLIVTWILVVIVFVVLYYNFFRSTKERKVLLKELIQYPFYFRDEKEKLLTYRDARKQDETTKTVCLDDWPIGSLEFDEKMKHIPGFQISPWIDERPTRKYLDIDLGDYEGITFSKKLVDIGKSKGIL